MSWDLSSVCSLIVWRAPSSPLLAGVMALRENREGNQVRHENIWEHRWNLTTTDGVPQLWTHALHIQQIVNLQLEYAFTQ